MTARWASAGAVAAVVAVIAGAAAPAAHADTPVRTQLVAMNCVGLSPNIVDLPYNGGVRVQTRTSEPGEITVIGGSTSATRYYTDATITIRNDTAHTSGTITRRYLHTPGGSAAGGYTIPNVYTGPGRVSITITAVNHGLLTIAGPTCRGTVTVH